MNGFGGTGDLAEHLVARFHACAHEYLASESEPRFRLATHAPHAVAPPDATLGAFELPSQACHQALCHGWNFGVAGPCGGIHRVGPDNMNDPPLRCRHSCIAAAMAAGARLPESRRERSALVPLPSAAMRGPAQQMRGGACERVPCSGSELLPSQHGGRESQVGLAVLFAYEAGRALHPCATWRHATIWPQQSATPKSNRCQRSFSADRSGMNSVASRAHLKCAFGHQCCFPSCRATDPMLTQ